VTIEDDGVAFDPLARAAPDVTADLDEREIGGLGIHLVRTLMDGMTYERRGERNVLVIVKRVA
jgi:serine/threonine-protein kinase RsbW